MGLAGVVGISAFLPWVSVFGISVAGINGDGKITLIAALVGLGAMLSLGRIEALSRSVAYGLNLGAASLASIVALADMNSFAAIGLYLTLLAGLGWVAVSVWAWRKRHEFGTGGDHR